MILIVTKDSTNLPTVSLSAYLPCYRRRLLLTRSFSMHPYICRFFVLADYLWIFDLPRRIVWSYFVPDILWFGYLVSNSVPGYVGMLALTTKISAPKVKSVLLESEPVAFWLSQCVSLISLVYIYDTLMLIYFHYAYNLTNSYPI